MEPPTPKLTANRSHRLLGWAVIVCFSIFWPAEAQETDRAIRRVDPASETRAGAQRRQALVIGNRNYDTGSLQNSINDARDMAARLYELGFEVEELIDADHQAMETAIRAFGQHLRPAASVGVFYYAGHAVQIDGLNYLIPVGADIRSPAEVKYKAVSLGFILDHMGEAIDHLNIVVLDSCRNNPFPWFRGSAQGLAQTDAPTGTLIAYGTAPGMVARDGDGRHGVFTEHLLEALLIPGLTIEEVLKQTRKTVLVATNNQQVPWVSTSLVGEFIPRPEEVSPDPPPVAPRPPGDTFPWREPEQSGILSRLKHGSASWDRQTEDGAWATVSIYLFDDHYHLGSEDRDMYVVIDGETRGTFYLTTGGYNPMTHEMFIEVSPGYHEVWLEWRRHSSDILRVEMRPGRDYVFDAYTTFWRGKVKISFRD